MGKKKRIPKSVQSNLTKSDTASANDSNQNHQTAMIVKDKSSPPEAPSPPTDNFGTEIDRFIVDINSLQKVIAPLMVMLQGFGSHFDLKHNQYAEKYCETERHEDWLVYKGAPDKIAAMRALLKTKNEFKRSLDLIPCSIFVTLVSSYDAYLGRLVKRILKCRPDIIDSDETKLTFAQLSKFDSIEEARNNIIDKTIESFLRTSHLDQLKWFEKILNIPMTKGLGCVCKLP